MAKKNPISILFPDREGIVYRNISDASWHDLGLDSICDKLTQKVTERSVIASVMRAMTDDPFVASYRAGVFNDIMKYPDLRTQMMELLSHVQFLNDYGNFKKDHDMRTGVWELLHRLSELDDYIKCVEQIRECLEKFDITSEGLKTLHDHIDMIYQDSLFAELKQDIAALKANTDNLKSITVGINLNRNFQVDSIGLISVNKKEFKSSGILSNFSEAVTTRNGLKDDEKWDGHMRFHPVDNSSADFSGGNTMKLGALYAAARVPLLTPLLASTLVTPPDNDPAQYVTRFFDKEVSGMLNLMTRRLEQVLSKYVNFSIGNIADLIPEFMFYIRWAEYIEKLKEKGYEFCTPVVLSEEHENSERSMQAVGLYNLKLATVGEMPFNDIVKNDLDFSREHSLYLLTGANRGGKTTITQAIGLIYVLAQGGISVPCRRFEFIPVDCIYTHYPADEDKTMDLGRLGEECSRFKAIFDVCTDKSLLLLNETFSTTSFEEGYFIAKDAIRAILTKGSRTVYNTHMHKLALEIDELNAGIEKSQAASLVAVSTAGKRSFKMKTAPPEGRSYAEDIAVRYGVTFEQLTASEKNSEE
ncbi:MAG: DNA mismatch repair protein [Lachnospiraceae bacterium]|nr:DNA mismatch repair protein [Lachnospiraceae bacterium]